MLADVFVKQFYAFAFVFLLNLFVQILISYIDSCCRDFQAEKSEQQA
jgi:hypothetical protein